LGKNLELVRSAWIKDVKRAASKSKTPMPNPPITNKEPRTPGTTVHLQTLMEGPDKNAAPEQNSHGIQGHAAPGKIGIFISYNHEDRVLATVLRQCLITLSSDLAPFIDHIGLEAGDKYENELEKSIGASQWFIMLCSGPLREKDMSWCLYEAGQFRRKFLQESTEQQIKSHLFAIYDHELPSPLAHLQGVLINRKDIFGHNLDLKTDKKAEELEEEALALFENTPIFNCFKTIISKSREEPLQDLTDTSIRRVLKTNSRTLISAFINHTIDRKLDEIVFQPRISFWLIPPAGQSSGPSKLIADTPVTADGDVLKELFGLIGKRTTWGTIKASCSEETGNEPAWVNEVEAAAEQVSRDRQPKQPAGLHWRKSDQKFFRVIFARCDPYTSGSRLCYILFIPRSRRDFDVKEKTSILLSSLILSIRFRQRVLPLAEKLQAVPRKGKSEGVLEIEKKLLEIETEALEFCLQTPDDDPEEFPILEVFREGQNKLFVEQSIVSWQTIRGVLAGVFKRVKSADPVDLNEIAFEGTTVIVNELKDYQEVNGKFIRVLTEELLFLERVAAGTTGAKIKKLSL
jgi:hypothetical protein